MKVIIAGSRTIKNYALIAEAVEAFWDGHSRGTKHMIDVATREGLKIHIKVEE